MEWLIARYHQVEKLEVSVWLGPPPHGGRLAVDGGVRSLNNGRFVRAVRVRSVTSWPI